MADIEGEPDRVNEALPDDASEADALPLKDTEGQLDGVADKHTVGLKVLTGLAVALGSDVMLTVTEPDALGASLNDADDDREKLADMESANDSVEEGLKLLELQAEAVGLRDDEVQGVADIEGEPDRVNEALPDRASEADALPLKDTEGQLDGVAVRHIVALKVLEGLAVALGSDDALKLKLPDELGEPLREALPEKLKNAEEVGSSDTLTDAVPDMLGSLLKDAEGDKLKLVVAEGATVAVTDGLKLLELQAEAVGL